MGARKPTGLLLSGLLLVGGVQADPIVTAQQPEAILNVARGHGSASLKTDASGDPMIEGRIDGTKYFIFFYGCNDEGKDCDDIQFAAAWSGYDVTVVDANRWNSKKRFGKAYIDGDGDPVLAMTVNIDYGVTLSNLDDTFKWWTRALEGFKEEVL